MNERGKSEEKVLKILCKRKSKKSQLFNPTQSDSINIFSNMDRLSKEGKGLNAKLFARLAAQAIAPPEPLASVPAALIAP